MLISCFNAVHDILQRYADQGNQSLLGTLLFAHRCYLFCRNHLEAVCPWLQMSAIAFFLIIPVMPSVLSTRQSDCSSKPRQEVSIYCCSSCLDQSDERWSCLRWEFLLIATYRMAAISPMIFLCRHLYLPSVSEGGGVAQWLGCWISDQGVPGSTPGRCTFRCGLKQVTFTPCLVLVKPRKRWTDD